MPPQRLIEVKLTFPGQRFPVFEIVADGEGPCAFVLSIHKCGSSVFNKICGALAAANGKHVVRVEDILFQNNITPRESINCPEMLQLLRAGNVYTGFRAMPGAFLDSDLFLEGRKLFMIRDPRDALVSQFFSDAYSHPVPATDGPLSKMLGEQRAMALHDGIDATVIRLANAMRRTFLAYSPLLHVRHVTIFKYEEFIREKRRLIETILDVLKWSAEPSQIDAILSWANIFPETENPRAFIRHVVPGDHRDKLRGDTITKLNRILKPAMDMFNYF